MSSHETTPPTNHSNSTSQPPQQAGRFKPRKAATLKTSSSGRGLPASNSTIPGISANATDESNHKQAKQQEQAKTQGRQRNSKGGRGGTRGSTNSTPKGQVFFTGTAKTNPSSNRSKPKNASSSTYMDQVNSSNMESTDVILPGFDSTIGKYSKATTGNVIGRTAQERMLASALARRGEGEEVIVGTLDGDRLNNAEYDSDGDFDSHPKKKKGDVLTSTQTSSRNQDYDFSNNNDDDYYHNNTYNEYDHTYDSDSSEQNDDEQNSSALHPQRLPFPPPRRIGTPTLEPLYACQTNYEMKSSEKGNKSPKLIQENFAYTDPPPVAPFRILNNEDDKKEEQSSWMLFKFPTRLPRLAPHCITSNGGKTRADTSNTAAKESTEQMGMAHESYLSNHNDGTTDTNGITNAVPDAVSSSYFHDESTEMNHSSFTSRTTNTYSSNHLYDDTLKDTSAGRYGKIVVHKSGKAYLVVGGTDSKTPQVRMLLQNGLSCGFLQQAVSIRTATDRGSGSYTPLGEVHKTIVVTPDVESAFS